MLVASLMAAIAAALALMRPPARRLRLYDQVLGVGRGQAAQRVRHVEARQERARSASRGRYRRGDRPRGWRPARLACPAPPVSSRCSRCMARGSARGDRQQGFGLVAQQQQLGAAPGCEAAEVREQRERVFFVGQGGRDAERAEALEIVAEGIGQAPAEVGVGGAPFEVPEERRRAGSLRGARNSSWRSSEVLPTRRLPTIQCARAPPSRSVDDQLLPAVVVPARSRRPR